MQERFHGTSAGEFGSTFIKAGDAGTRKGLGGKKQQESPGGAALAPCEVKEKGALEQDQGVS